MTASRANGVASFAGDAGTRWKRRVAEPMAVHGGVGGGGLRANALLLRVYFRVQVRVGV